MEYGKTDGSDDIDFTTVNKDDYVPEIDESPNPFVDEDTDFIML